MRALYISPGGAETYDVTICRLVSVRNGILNWRPLDGGPPVRVDVTPLLSKFLRVMPSDAELRRVLAALSPLLATDPDTKPTRLVLDLDGIVLTRPGGRS